MPVCNLFLLFPFLQCHMHPFSPKTKATSMPLLMLGLLLESMPAQPDHMLHCLHSLPIGAC